LVHFVRADICSKIVAPAHTAMDLVGVLAFFSVFFYQLNGHVLKQMGKVKVCDPITLVWILHAVIALLAPYVYLQRKALAEELRRMRLTYPRFLFAVVFNSFLQMSVNFMWFLSAKAVPTQLTSAIYQTAIGLVYVCSVLFLGEKVSFWKALGVSVAIVGVGLTSLFPPTSGAATMTSTSTTPAREDFVFGVAMAFGAMVCKCASQIFCKIELEGGSGHFMFMYGIHMGIAHLYAILPAMLLADRFGVDGMSFQLYDTSFTSMRLMLCGVAISTFVSFGYQSVAVVRSPLFLCRFQVLGIVFAVTMDFLMYGDVPQFGGYCGYACILTAFLLVSGLVDPSKAQDKIRSAPTEITLEAAKAKPVTHEHSSGKLITKQRVLTPRGPVKSAPDAKARSQAVRQLVEEESKSKKQI